MQQESHYHVKHLDDALNTISKVRMIFCRMNLASKEKLLKEMVHRVVVNQEGQIIDVEWRAPECRVNHLMLVVALQRNARVESH